MTDAGTNAARILDGSPEGIVLTDLARDKHPTISWWWGRRQVDGTASIMCYVCDCVIAEWNGYTRTWPDVQPAVTEHRDKHLAEMHAETTATPETT